MDVEKHITASQKDEINVAVEQATQARKEGNYGKVIELLEPLLKFRLSPKNKLYLLTELSNAAGRTNDYKKSLSWSQQYIAEGYKTPESKLTIEYACSIARIAVIHLKLRNILHARFAVEEAIKIMKQLKLENDQRYREMLITLGTVEYDENKYEKAMELYQRAKSDVDASVYQYCYAGLLVSIYTCYHKMDRLNEAYLTLKECIEFVRKIKGSESPGYACQLCKLGRFYAGIKQYEMAIPLFEKVLSIYQSKKDPRKIDTEKELADAREKAQNPHREDIDEGHLFRMCGFCEKVAEDLKVCEGCYKAWYCNEKCQLKHWPVHKSFCNVCITCETHLDRDDFYSCSRCQTKYCNQKCQKKDWMEHKKQCTK